MNTKALKLYGENEQFVSMASLEFQIENNNPLVQAKRKVDINIKNSWLCIYGNDSADYESDSIPVRFCFAPVSYGGMSVLFI